MAIDFSSIQDDLNTKNPSENSAYQVNENDFQNVNENESVSENNNNNGILKAWSGFGKVANNGLITTQSNYYSEYFETLKKLVEDGLRRNDEQNKSLNLPKVRVTIVPQNSEFGNIPYGMLMLSCLTSANICYYYFFQFAHTGKPAMDAGELLETFDRNLQYANMNDRANTKPYITYDASVGTKLKIILKKNLAKAYGTAVNEQTKFVSLQGSNFNPHVQHAKVETVANSILEIGFNTLFLRVAFTEGRMEDINIKEVLPQNNKQEQNYTINIDVNLTNPGTTSTHNPDDYTDRLGNFIRSDFLGVMSLESTQKQGNELCSLQETQELSKFAGYVSAIPAATSEAVKGFQNQIRTVTRMHPHIILTELKGNARTIGGSLMSLIASSIMLKRENYMACIKNSVGTTLNCPGAYNMLCNLSEETKEENIKPIDFSKPKPWDESRILNCLESMFTLNPILSADFLPLGDNADIDNVFILASRSDIQEDIRMKALTAIIQSAHDLTNGHFPIDFNPHDIFAMSAISFPFGHYSDNKGFRDLRNIDLATVITMAKGNQQPIMDWMMSEIPTHVGNYDPFFNKIRVLTRTLGASEATIVGRGVRVTFKPVFIETLIRSAQIAGLNPNYRPFGITQKAGMDLGQFSMYFGNSGISNVNFGTQINMNPTYQGGQFFMPSASYGSFAGYMNQKQ